MHVLTAAAINGIEPEAVTKEQRAAAKPVNFGSIYGMSAKGLSAAAWSGYGIELPEADAKLALDRFFAKYSGPAAVDARRTLTPCKRARRVMIGAGRVVENAWEAYPLGYPQMCNLPVQGICADCMMRAIALVHAELPGVLVAMVHDELLAEVPEADADATVETLKILPAPRFRRDLPRSTDARAGRRARRRQLGGAEVMPALRTVTLAHSPAALQRRAVGGGRQSGPDRAGNSAAACRNLCAQKLAAGKRAGNRSED